MITVAVGRASAWLFEYAFKPFGIAVVFVLIALLWTFPLQHLIAYPFVFLFFGAVMASAWFGGFIAGAWAIMMSSVLVGFLFIPPFYSMKINRDVESYFGAFIVCAIAITAISASRRRSEDLSRAVREELEHRVRERTFELEKSNEEIIGRERQLRALTEAIPQQIWRASADGRVEYCNQDLIKFTGKPINELAGEKFFAILHPSDSPVFYQSWRSARESKSSFEMEARVMSATGQHRWFLIRGIPQFTASGDITHWYGVHIDIEELYRAEQSLRVAQGDSARWSRTLSMGEMAASIAHELKQPLTALVTQAQACRRWLQADPVNADKAANAAESLVRESARASLVIDRVRSLFSEKDQHREPADLNAIIKDVVRLLRDEVERSGIVLRLELASGLPYVEVDPVQIQQVLVNLLTNGIESASATAKIPEVMVSSTAIPDRQVMIRVRDNGAGLTDRAREHMFDPFFTTKPHGTGIGLSICRSIIEAHDGRIWAEAAGQGAVFHVVLGSGQ
jgi:hypothetical protein